MKTGNLAVRYIQMPVAIKVLQLFDRHHEISLCLRRTTIHLSIIDIEISITVDREHIFISTVIECRLDCPARTKRLIFDNIFELNSVERITEMLYDCLVLISDRHNDPLNTTAFQRRDYIFQKRSAVDRRHRLGKIGKHRAESGALAARQNDRFHHRSK